MTTINDNSELIEKIRDRGRRRVETTSLRHVAKQIGMSPTGLYKFLQGAQPYSKTFLRLNEWYLLEASNDVDYPSFEGTVAAILTLSGFFDTSSRAQHAHEILDRLERARGNDLPSWFGRLRSYDWENSPTT